MLFLNPAHRRRKAFEDRRGTFTPFVLSAWMGYFTKRLVTSLSTWPLLRLQSGTKPIPSPAATSDPGSLLQGFEQLASVVKDPAPNGEVGSGLMMVLLWPHSWSKFLTYYFSF